MAPKIWQILWRSLLLMMLTGIAGAAEPVIFENCVDGQGGALPAVADSGQAALVRTIVVHGRPEIRYNPDALPQLSNSARLFFYANQCARHGLRRASDHLADCIALNTLLEGGQLTYQDLPALQAELKFSDDEWRLLPGSARRVELDNCRRPARGNVLSLPLPAQPSAGQVDWNSCVRGCADKLWTCQKASHADDANCQSTYDHCRSACGK